MATTLAMGGSPKTKQVVWLLKGYIYPAAAMLGVMGSIMLFSALDPLPPLRRLDALFGLSTRTVLLIAAVLHLSLSCLLFIRRDPVTQSILSLWAGWNHIAYYVGTAWVMNVPSPFPTEVAVAWKVGLSSKTMDVFWKAFIAYLVVGSLTFLVFEWRRLNQLKSASFLKHWSEMRELGVGLAKQRGHDKILVKEVAKGEPHVQSQDRDEISEILVSDFKFSCPSCGQHIRCDVGYSGRQVYCPACQKQILVPASGAELSRHPK
jgi:hypothetical protein